MADGRLDKPVYEIGGRRFRKAIESVDCFEQ